jgi:hypothetical protein
MAPHLLSLPKELRDMIYTHIFSTDDSIQLHLDLTPTSIRLRSKTLPLRSICKQIREETLDMNLLRYKTFHISLVGDPVHTDIPFRELYASEINVIESVDVTCIASLDENHVSKKEVLNAPSWLSEDVLRLKTRLPGLKVLLVTVYVQGPKFLHEGPWRMACRSQISGWMARIQEWNKGCAVKSSYRGGETPPKA